MVLKQNIWFPLKYCGCLKFDNCHGEHFSDRSSLTVPMVSGEQGLKCHKDTFDQYNIIENDLHSNYNLFQRRFFISLVHIKSFMM